ncbi:MAG: hypothetical protein KIS85_07975 [Anaerolineales bacterium]|nr:hypothetical protein [Anaerolineales bacterium]
MATRLDAALEECLDRLRTGEADLEECLQLYPDLQDELRPLLITAGRLQEVAELKPRPEFRSQTRAMLSGYLRAKPRQRPMFSIGFLRLATGVAVLFVALTTTSAALAQSAMPGDTLYPVKLVSERVWRSLQNDQVSADAFLANRRVEELQAVQGQADLEQIGAAEYAETLEQLINAAEDDPQLAAWLNQLLLVQKASLQDLLSNSQADLSDLEKLFNVILSPLNGAAPEPAPPESHTPNTGSGIPAVATATAIPHQGDSLIPALPLLGDSAEGLGLITVIEDTLQETLENTFGILKGLLGTGD